MKPSRRLVVAYLRDAYGVSARIVPGGKHPKCCFTYRGREFKLAFSGSPGDHRWFENHKSQIRQHLGPPPLPQPVFVHRRKLADMSIHPISSPRTDTASVALKPGIIVVPEKPSPLPGPDFIGLWHDAAAAVYDLSPEPKHRRKYDRRLSLHIPDSVASMFGPGGVKIERADTNMFRITRHPVNSTPSLVINKSTPDGYKIVAMETDIANDLPAFGKTAAKCRMDGNNAIMVYFDVTKLKSPRKTKNVAAVSAAGGSGRNLLPDPQLVDAPEPVRVPVRVPHRYAASDMKALIAMINEVEACTEYRLEKRSRSPGEEPVWSFQVPPIFVD